MKRYLALLVLVAACGASPGAKVGERGSIDGWGWAAIQVETLSGRVVDCVVYGEGGISCDWNER